jgi:hypothetical protein
MNEVSGIFSFSFPSFFHRVVMRNIHASTIFINRYIKRDIEITNTLFDEKENAEIYSRTVCI